MYYLLTESYRSQEQQLVQIILEAVPADKIYLLGSTLMTRRTESIFMTDAPSCRYVGHYHILVLISGEHNLNAIQDKIENRCLHFIPVTAIVLQTEIFNAWLAEGHQFAHIVCRIAVVLYGENEKHPVSANALDRDLIKDQNKTIYKEGYNKVSEFLAGAELFNLRQQNKMAAFMLHQAAEHALHTILKVGTGLYINTHNLDKLIRYCSMVSYKIPEIFPSNNEENKRLFSLLQKAYIHTRYKEDYAINNADLATITERIKEFQSLMKDVCKTELPLP